MILEKIVELKPEESKLLYSSETDKQTIEVREWQQYRWLHIGDDSVQTLMLLDDLEFVALDNIQAMLATLIFCPSATRLLNFGLGGASLERFLNSKKPEIKMKSVESNEEVIKIAKDYFYLPIDFDVINDTADNFISNDDELYDIVLCDIFVADMLASCLYDNDFYANISRCLDKAGVLAINILPESEDEVIKILLPIKDYFDQIYLLEFPDYMNAIIFVSRHKLPDTDKMKVLANDLFIKTKLDLRDLPERLNVLLETV
jgi:spermidine synthase